MPRLKQPLNLGDLAVKEVAVAVQRTCRRIDTENSTLLKNQLESFAVDLPGPVLELLFNQTIAGLIERLQRNKDEKGLLAALNILLQPNMSIVDLGSMFFKVRLSRELSRQCATILSPRLSKMSSLTRLNLCSRCTDTALETIASTCHQLNYLNISYSDLVTDAGLLRLASGGRENAGCRKLQYLGIMKLWDVNVEGVAALLDGLPILTILQYDRCGDVIEHVKSKSLPLSNFDQSYYIYSPSYEQVAGISKVCPDITSLRLYVADTSLPHFSILDKVQKVDVELDGAAGSGLESWLACAGSSLNTLNLTFESLTWQQLEMICRRCPNLRNVRLLGSELVWDEGAEICGRFPAVEELRLTVWGDAGVKPQLLEWIFESAAPTLTVLAIDAVITFINDEYLSNMFATYQLPRLEELVLTGAPKDHLTINGARLAMHLCANLKKLVGFEIKKSELRHLSNEIRINNYDLEVV